MAERKTLLSSTTSAPTVQPIGSRAVEGAFGDYRGLQQFGRGVQSAGDELAGTAMYMKRREESLSAAKEERDRHDADLVARRIIAEEAVAARTEFSSKLNETPPDNIMEMTNGVLSDARSRVDQKLSTQTNPQLANVANKDYLDYHWIQSADGLMTQASNTQAALKVATREDDAVRTSEALINLAGNDTANVVRTAHAALSDVKKNAGIYGRDFPGKFKDTLEKQVTNSLMGAVILNGGVDEHLVDHINSAHQAGFVSTENMDRMYTYTRQAQETSRANATAAVEKTLDEVRSGKVEATDHDRQSLHSTAGYNLDKEADLDRQLDRKFLVNAAIGKLNGRNNEGVLAFPWNAEVDKSGQPIHPSVFSTIDKLKPNGNPDEVRKIMGHLLEGHKDVNTAEFTSQEVEKFRSDSYSILTDQVNKINNLQGYEIAQRSPVIQKMMADEVAGAQVPVEMYAQAYRAWYTEQNIPLEKQVIIHAPHIALVKDAYKKGNIDNFMNVAQAVATAYDPVAVGRAFSADKESRPILPVMRVLAQLPLSDNPNVQQGGIKTLARKLTEAAFDYARNGAEIEKAHPGELEHANKLLSQAGIAKPGVLATLGAKAAHFSSFGLVNPEAPTNDLRVPVVLSILSNESAEMAGSFRDALAYATVQDAYGPGGTQDLAVSAQQISNSLFTAFVPIRTGGSYSERPAFALVPADMKNRGRVENLILGPAGGEATSPEKMKEYTEAAIDGFFLDGLQDVKYTASAKLGLSYVDNFLAATALQDLGYRANGYENNSMEMFHGNDPNPAARLSYYDRIPFQDLVIVNHTVDANGKSVEYREPLAKNPLYFKSTFGDFVENYVKKNVAGQPGTDLHSMNHQVLAKNRVLRQLPNGDFQVFLSPASKKVETVEKGAVTGYAPVMVEVRNPWDFKRTGELKPLIIPWKDIKAFRDSQLDLRLDANQAISGKATHQKLLPYPTDRNFFDKP